MRLRQVNKGYIHEQQEVQTCEASGKTERIINAAYKTRRKKDPQMNLLPLVGQPILSGGSHSTQTSDLPERAFTFT